MRLLLEYGADPKARDKVGSTPLIAATANPDPGVAGLLLERGADLEARNREGHTPLLAAACENKAKPGLIRLLMAQGAKREARDIYGDTPLIAACRYAPTSVVRLLIERGANVNAQEPYHETALFLLLLCSSGPEDHKAAEMIPLLLAHGANPHVGANHGLTPLGMARIAKRPDLIKALQRGGAKR